MRTIEKLHTSVYKKKNMEKDKHADKEIPQTNPEQQEEELVVK